jgi:Na+/proline symporter
MASIALIVLLTLFYTFEGGMTAVIWTDVVQMTLYVVGAVVSFFVILGQIPGGWHHVVAVAAVTDKLAIFDFRFSLTMEFFARKYSFWAGLAGGCFLTTASHGTDQLMVQRLLSARDERQSRTALLASWVVIAVQFTLFLLIGLLLFVYYGDHRMAPPERLDRIYPLFIWSSLPVGVAGLAIAAILVDFIRTRVKGLSEARSLQIARLATVAWGVVLLPIALRASQSRSVLEAGLSIASIPSGVLLGVFLLGVLTTKPREGAAIAGVVAGMAAILYVWLATPIAFTWYVAIGATVTFTVGVGASLFEKKAPVQRI